MKETTIEEGKIWHDEPIVMKDEEKWWGAGYSGLTKENLEPTEKMPTDNGSGPTPTPTGETMNVKYGIYRDATINDITDDELSALPNVKIEDDLTDIIFNIDKIEQGDLDYETYRNLYEKCLVVLLPKGKNLIILDAMGTSAMSEYTLIREYYAENDNYLVYARRSNGELIPDEKITLLYKISR